jgi:hypothetical protein
MATDRKSFNELLQEAPAAAQTVSLMGTLSRSSEPDKFVITLASGQSLTLDVDAVKDHTVMGGAVGQLVVKVDLDPSRVPSDARTAATETQRPVEQTVFWQDVAKSPFLDSQTVLFLDLKAPQLDVAGPGPVPPGGDPWGGLGAQMLAPFALATAHQAPAQQIAAIQAAYRRGHTLPWPIGWGGNDPILPKVMADPTV